MCACLMQVLARCCNLILSRRQSIKHFFSVVIFVGPNKVAFLITNYSWPVDNPDTDLISPTLRRRLYSQEPLRVYLDREQVLSWVDSPSKVQATKLVELAQLENNPQNNLLNQACIIL